MINRIISFSIQHKFIISLFVVTLIAAGIYSMTTINLGSVPDITNNQVQVITVSQNLSTQDIEQFITYPVELSMANLPGVSEIRSVSRFGLSVVTIVFRDQMGTYLPRQLVQEKLNEVKEKIPEKFGVPSMGPITTGLGEVYQYTLKPGAGYDTAYTAMELRTIQDWIVKRQMALVPGVVEVNAFGGYIKQYEIAINPEKLNAMDVTISEVFEALERNNLNTGGAYIEKNNMANFIRGEGLARSLEDIREIIIKNVNGIPILVQDVAEKVHYGNQVRYGAFTQDGQEAVGGMVLMLRGENPNAVIRNVKKRMREVQKSLPEGLEIKPFLDRSALINRTTHTVIRNLAEGALIVVFVLVILLGSFRGGLITASVIPLSLLFAFILMKITHVWANLMSLGAIDFGIIVDGAVIIVEGTVHEVEKRMKTGQTNFGRQQMDRIAYEAGSTMMNSAFFGQLIILIVFAPILFLTGVEGKMFRPMAFTFGYAVLGAILLCLTYVPMVSSWILKPAMHRKTIFIRFEEGIEHFSQVLISMINRIYLPLIRGAVRKRALVILLAVVLFAMAIYTFSSMGGEFIPQLDEGDIAMQALIRPGSGLTEMIHVSTSIENILLENFPEVETAVTRIGVADIPTDPMPMDIADVFIILEKDENKWITAHSKDELIAKIKETLNARMTGVNLVFSQPVELRFNELLTGIREDVAVKLYGDDLEILAGKVQEMSAIIQTIPGVGDVTPERITGLPQMTVRYNRGKVAQYGLDIQKLNEYVSTAFAGGVAGIIFEGEKRFDMVVRFDAGHRQSIDDLRTLYIDLPDGTQIPIQEVADIQYRPGPMQISRENTFRRSYVGVNVRGRDVESVVKDIQMKLDAELDLPPGYYISYGGEFENLQQAKDRLKTVVPVTLFLIFILLYFALGSFIQSAMIYIAIPLAAIGGIFFLALRDMPFSISAGVGFIVLFGVAVLNGLVMVSRFNSLKKEGVMDLDARIIKGTRERLRPILLTAGAAIMGFTPMAFSTSAGAEVQRPLATVVIGGLISATLLTLLVIPVLYHLAEKWQEKKPSPTASRIILLLWAVLITVYPSKGSAQKIQVENEKNLPEIGLTEAVAKAIHNYPKVRMAALEVRNQEVLRKTAWDFGKTQVFTGKEEVGNGSAGIYTTLGIQQQNLDVFGIGPKLSLQKEKITLAESALDLTEIEIEKEVSIAWGEVYTTRNIFRVYQEMDSIFAGIERASKIRLETEAISRLEFLANTNQAARVAIRLEQAYHDYMGALQKLNRWFGVDTLYTVPNAQPEQLDEPLAWTDDSLRAHPLLNNSLQKVQVADASVRLNKSRFLPKIQGQYGFQQISDQSGFYTFQLGIQVPLFFGPEWGHTQSAIIQRDLAETNLQLIRLDLNATYLEVREQYLKWLDSWIYYRDEVLPLAGEQKRGAMTAYREGNIDYVTFLQNIRDAMNMEIESWEALGNFLHNRSRLEYYLKSTLEN